MVVNDDPHIGWEIFPHIALAFAWAIAFFGYAAAQKDKTKPIPQWVSALQGTFLFSLGATTGLVIIAERLTRSWPNCFPVMYIGLFVALFAPLWIWNPQANKRFTWRDASLVFLYMVLFTFIFALKFKYQPDGTINSPYWMIALAIIALGLLVTALFKKQRKQAIIAICVIVGLIGWIQMVSWVSTWIV